MQVYQFNTNLNLESSLVFAQYSIYSLSLIVEEVLSASVAVFFYSYHICDDFIK